ncbi:MAG: YIP1 family protein [Holophagaceae bacterium]|nr:YIP1 family protein [Holophagaceae bacterium]
MSDQPNATPEAELYGGVPKQAPPAPPGLVDQFAGLFTEPSALFQRLNAAPSWVPALLTTLIVSLVLVAAWAWHVDVDAMMRPGMEANPRMTPEQVDQAIGFMTRFFPYIALVQTALMVPLGTLLFAFLLWLVGKFSAVGDKPSFVQALSATTVPGLAGLPNSLIITLMCFVRPVGGSTPEKLSPASLAFYLHPENPKVHALLGAVDLFGIFSYVLVYLAARHLLRLKAGGAILCVVLVVLLLNLPRVLGAR